MSLLKAALWYRDNGFSVIPVRKDKRPLVKWKEYHTKIADRETVELWWNQWPDAQVGIVCGAVSGVTVIDIDSPEEFDRIKKECLNGTPIPTAKTPKGYHLYFQYKEGVKNEVRFMNDCDVRNFGGYVMAPPSSNTQGPYQWVEGLKITDAKPPEMPKVFVDAILEKQSDKPKQEAHKPVQQKQSFNQADRYGQAALSAEVESVINSGKGERNNTLNNAALKLGQLVAGGEIDRGIVEASLLGAGVQAGLKVFEVQATIKSGIEAGMKSPRTAPEQEEWGIDELENELGVSTCKQESAEKSENKPNDASCKQESATCKQRVSTGGVSCKQGPVSCKQDSAEKRRIDPNSLATQIGEWITNSGGSFHVRDIDQEFCLTTRSEKNNRSRVINIYKNKKLIKKDRTRKGVWHVIDTEVDWVDLDNVKEEHFPIKLPFNLHEKVLIPPKGIIILAGSSNAGKTAFLLNAIRMNLADHGTNYPIHYYMSEMGGAEFKSRITNFGDDLGFWKKLKAASKSYDFDGAIQAYNANGLTVIDFLEDVDGEYFKIASSIRGIYDALENGVAMVAIQKKTGADYARGGESTSEKARLYMSLDYLATRQSDIVCALKIIKAKHFLGDNINNHEIHFSITRGCRIKAITEWLPSASINREYYKMLYGQKVEMPKQEPDDLVFQLTDGSWKRIVPDQILTWQKNYKHIDVKKELERIAVDSVKKPFLDPKKYFFVIGGILAKRNGENEKHANGNG